MGLFLISTVGCIFSRDISQFVLWRFVQGVAGAGGVVISRSIAADKYSAHELAGMLATIGAVNGIATVVAPIGGGALADFGGWHGIFWFCLYWAFFWLSEVYVLRSLCQLDKGKI